MTLKRFIQRVGLAAIAAGCTTLAACNAVEGVGEAGDAIEDAAGD